MKIRHTTTHVYYDGPQVWEGRDNIGGHYIGVMVEPEGDKERHMVVGVAPERLRQFRVGDIDLLSLLLDRDDDEWYLATVSDNGELELDRQSAALASFAELPEPGFFLHAAKTEAIALQESRSRNNLVLEVAVEPPEAAVEHRIHTETLADLLLHVQTMVKHAYSSAIRDFSQKIKQNLDRTDAHILDVVVPAMAGSFRIVMEATKKPDNLFGMTEMGRALELVDALFANAADTKATVETVKEHRGRLAGAYLRLLRFLVKSNSGFCYSWAEPAFVDARRNTLTKSQAVALVDALSGVSNLSAETVVLVGSLRKADIDNNSWRLATEDGEISGTIKQGGPSLSGLKIDSTYKFTCIEETEEDYEGWRERRVLYLTEYESL